MAINPKWDVPAGELGKVVRALIESGAAKVTSFLTPNLTVKAAVVQFNGKVPGARARAFNVRVTIGKPNYAERKFIKLCRKAGEPFPVKKLQMRPA